MFFIIRDLTEERPGVFNLSFAATLIIEPVHKFIYQHQPIHGLSSLKRFRDVLHLQDRHPAFLAALTQSSWKDQCGTKDDQ